MLNNPSILPTSPFLWKKSETPLFSRISGGIGGGGASNYEAPNLSAAGVFIVNLKKKNFPVIKDARLYNARVNNIKGLIP